MLSAEDKKWISGFFEKQDKRFEKQDERFDRIEHNLSEQRELLEKHSKLLEKHSELLENQGVQLEKHGSQIQKMQNNADAQLKRILATMDKHAAELREESDKRFAAMMEEQRKQNEAFTNACLDRIDDKLNELDKRFEAHEKRIDLLIENKVSIRLDAFKEYFPGAYKSYDRLEHRVDGLSLRQDILEQSFLDHVHEG